MWIFTQHGMLSIVAHREKTDVFLIRARVWSHLAMQVPPEVMVHSTPTADYPFRCEVDREQLGKIMAGAVDSVDYDNFKNAVREDDYHSVLFRVYAAAMALGYRRWWGRDNQLDFEDILEPEYETVIDVIKRNGGRL